MALDGVKRNGDKRRTSEETTKPSERTQKDEVWAQGYFEAHEALMDARKQARQTSGEGSPDVQAFCCFGSFPREQAMFPRKGGDGLQGTRGSVPWSVITGLVNLEIT